MLPIRRVFRYSLWSRLCVNNTNNAPRSYMKHRQLWTLAGNRCMQTPDVTRNILLASSRNYSINDQEDNRALREFENTTNETLMSLTDMFEEIAETHNIDPDFDVAFENGVLTVMISRSWGTYVINKQTPNRQIWLSSPLSGPKRYDLVDSKWVYSHDGVTLHELLSKEISDAFKQELNFTDCAYGK